MFSISTGEFTGFRTNHQQHEPSCVDISQSDATLRKFQPVANDSGENPRYNFGGAERYTDIYIYNIYIYIYIEKHTKIHTFVSMYISKTKIERGSVCVCRIHVSNTYPQSTTSQTPQRLEGASVDKPPICTWRSRNCRKKSCWSWIFAHGF